MRGRAERAITVIFFDRLKKPPQHRSSGATPGASSMDMWSFESCCSQCGLSTSWGRTQTYLHLGWGVWSAEEQCTGNSATGLL